MSRKPLPTTYKKAEVRSIYGATTEKVIITNGDITWEYVEQAWADREVKKSDTECWDWKGSWHRQGYGLFHVRRSGDKAKSGQMNIQRFAKARELGRPLLTSEQVYSTCHSKSCTNPAHLKIGDREAVINNSPDFPKRSQYADDYITNNLSFLLNSSRPKVAKALGVTDNQATHLKFLARNKKRVNDAIALLPEKFRNKLLKPGCDSILEEGGDGNNHGEQRSNEPDNTLISG
jgi:hypothetical protein